MKTYCAALLAVVAVAACASHGAVLADVPRNDATIQRLARGGAKMGCRYQHSDKYDMDLFYCKDKVTVTVSDFNGSPNRAFITCSHLNDGECKKFVEDMSAAGQ